MKPVRKFGAIELLFIPLIVLTAAMWIQDRLPASPDDVSAARTIGASSEAARAEVAAAMAATPDMNKREIRQLRERAVALAASASRSAGDPASTAMARERDRLAAQTMTDMTPIDIVRWALLASGQHAPLILGCVVGVCAALVVRRDARQARTRSEKRTARSGTK